MNNETVKELIERLKQLPQNAIVCKYECYNEMFGEPVYESLEICNFKENVEYISNNGVF